ncbi:hypothetical protein LAUMK191_02339 [Mycobacterium attenuatum]|nr:hypothetical protein LAUMK191_02339 [Mycobacterium attenuatum]
MAADTSSAPAAATAVVWATAAELASLMTEPIRARFPAAPDTKSVFATTNDIPHLHSEASATEESYRDFGTCDCAFPEQFDSNFSAQMQISIVVQTPARYPPGQ